MRRMTQEILLSAAMGSEPRILTVKSVNSEKPWKGKYSENVAYKLNVEEFGDEVEWSRKPDSPKPEPGQKIIGTVESTDFGLRFKQVQQRNSHTGSRNNGMSPEREAQIIRQHSQEMGVRVAVAGGYFDGFESATNDEKKAVLTDLRRLVDWFDADVRSKKESK